MSVIPRWLATANLAVLLACNAANACHTCKQTPCVLEPPPEPAYRYETEMVPFTVMKSRTKVDLVPSCTKTVMETKIEIEYDEQRGTVCRAMFDTIMQTRCTTVCRPVPETTLVCQSYRVCRPVTTTRQVTEYCMKPYTELVTVPVKTACGRCGHSGGGCTCQTVARTCYKRVPVVRDVTETHMVSSVETRMVPVTRWRTEVEQRVDTVPVTICRLVNQPVRVKVPRMVIKSVPKTLVYKTAVMSCEEVPVTVYRPVLKMVPIVEASSQLPPSSQASPFDRGEESRTQPAPGEKEQKKVPAPREKPPAPAS